jgi:hypothetical protein
MKIGDRARIGLIALLLLSTGCAAKHAYQTMFCDRWSDDHKHCLSYAVHNYPCVSTPDGSCTKETK